MPDTYSMLRSISLLKRELTLFEKGRAHAKFSMLLYDKFSDSVFDYTRASTSQPCTSSLTISPMTGNLDGGPYLCPFPRGY
jgi:hypothetical protein